VLAGVPFVPLERRHFEYVHHLSPRADRHGRLPQLRHHRAVADREKLFNELRHLIRTHPRAGRAGELAMPCVTRCWRTRRPA
jgi:hypothetical protein